jgi:hypothetical protein
MMYQNSGTSVDKETSVDTETSVYIETSVDRETSAAAGTTVATEVSVSPAAPAPEDPRLTILKTGQVLVSDQLDISGGARPFSVQPSGLSTEVLYSMSMDINISQVGPSWRSLLGNNPVDAGGSAAIGLTRRRPGVFISGTAGEPSGPNHVHIVHSCGNNDNTNIVTSFAATPGTWFNLTWVVANGTLTTYINGDVDSKGTASGKFTWAPTNAWTWNYETWGQAGPVLVKNVYWFNEALSASDVALIGKKQTSGVSAYTLRYELGNPF